MKMTCRMQKELSDYQAGALDERRRAAVEQHLASCHACQRELMALNRTVALLQAAPQHDAPPRVWAGIAREIAPRRRHAARSWVPAFAAAILVAVVILAVVLPMIHGSFLAPQDSFADVQLAVAWDNPLADKAALGLALLATEDAEAPPLEFRENVN